jgi:hypothetical protein
MMIAESPILSWLAKTQTAASAVATAKPHMLQHHTPLFSRWPL